MTAIHRFRSAALVVFITMVSTAASHADLILTVSDATVSQSGTTTVDVFVSGDGGDQDLQTFDLVLELSPIDPTGDTSLVFVDPQTETHITTDRLDDYVFVDTSGAVLDDLQTSTVDNSEADFRQITFIDDSVDLLFDPVDILVSADPLERRLIASVEIAVGDGETATEGDEFSLVVSSDSLFFDAVGIDEILYASSNGTLTIGPSAIPEPSTAAALFLITGGMMMRRRRSRR